jgi:hypothetical protein
MAKAGVEGSATAEPWRWRTFANAAVAAGSISAVTEAMVVVPLQWSMGAPPSVLFQSIAYGALGEAAFKMGATSILLGLSVHLLISFVAAGLYAAAALRVPSLLRRPVTGGLVFGFVCFLVMVFVVIPLSKIGFHPPKKLALTGVSIATHMIAFGLPIALVATWRIRAERSRHRSRP